MSIIALSKWFIKVLKYIFFQTLSCSIRKKKKKICVRLQKLYKFHCNKYTSKIQEANKTQNKPQDQRPSQRFVFVMVFGTASLFIVSVSRYYQRMDALAMSLYILAHGLCGCCCFKATLLDNTQEHMPNRIFEYPVRKVEYTPSRPRTRKSRKVTFF